MQDLLNDIELDVRELRCLVQAIAEGADPALRRVACRNIGQLKARLDALRQQLEVPQPLAEAAQPVPQTPPAPQPAPEPVPPVPDVPQPPVSQPRPAEEPVSVPPAVEEASVPDPQPSVPEPAPAAAPILAERIRTAADLRHAISLNDSFRFTRELFGGDAARMNEVLRRLGEAPTLDDALALFAAEVQADEDNAAVADFVELLHKYFN